MTSFPPPQPTAEATLRNLEQQLLSLLEAEPGSIVRVPRRFLSPRVLRLAVERALSDPAIAGRARELGDWAQANDAGARAASLVERLAGDATLARAWTTSGESQTS